MKQVLLLVGMFICLHLSSSAQTYSNPASGDSLLIKIQKEPRFYVNIHSGYAIALGSTFKFYPDDISSIQVEKINNGAAVKSVGYKTPTKGLGEGIRFGAGISYIINDFINVGMDFDYFSSTISKVRDSVYHESRNTQGNFYDYLYKDRVRITYDATLLTISPNITFKAISRPKFFIYNKVGAILTFRPNSIERDEHQVFARTTTQGGFYRDSAGSDLLEYQWKIQNPSFGFTGAIGVQAKIAEKFRVFGELQFSHVVFVIAKRTTSSFMVNGKEMVNTLPPNVREIDFEKEYNATGGATDPNQPSRAITQRIPITYVGMNAGIVYRF
jgi:hypothetical protein